MKKFFAIAAVILIAAFVINYSLGGFDSVKPGLISTTDVTYFGSYYEGRYNSDTLEEIIASLRSKIEKEGSGVLTIINYQEEDLEKRGIVKQFVGIEWPVQAPKNHGLDSLYITAYNGVQFRVPIRPLVMPSPKKLIDMATEMATEMNTVVQGISIEQYQQGKLIINFPMK